MLEGTRSNLSARQLSPGPAASSRKPSPARRHRSPSSPAEREAAAPVKTASAQAVLQGVGGNGSLRDGSSATAGGGCGGGGGGQPRRKATMMYTFTTDAKTGLSCERGTALEVMAQDAQKHPNWILMRNPATQKTGFVPLSYVRLEPTVATAGTADGADTSNSGRLSERENVEEEARQDGEQTGKVTAVVNFDFEVWAISFCGDLICGHVHLQPSLIAMCVCVSLFGNRVSRITS